METFRLYRGKDADVLTVCAEIIEVAILHKPELIIKRATWADPFFPDLKTRIATAFSTFLGFDNAKAMREKTQALMSIMDPAHDNIVDFNVQLKEDFKSNKPRLLEIQTQLGITAHYQQMMNDDQEGTVELLMKFKANMSPALKLEITTAGIDATLIADIIAAADALNNANITQETAKNLRPSLTAAGVDEFNAIYEKVISIAVISTRIFKADAEVAKQFSFSKRLKALNHASPTPVTPV